MGSRLSPVFREAFAILRRYPAAALLPAAALGAASDLLQLIDGGPLAVAALAFGLAIIFELYVAYAERLIVEAGRGAERVSAVQLLRAAGPLLPRLVVASIPAVVLPVAASGLLVLPGLWLATRWVLYAPVIAREGVGSRAALRRSSELVKGRFWPVFAVATVSLIIEHAVIHATALTAEPLLGSRLLGLLGAAIAVAAVSPFAALTISLVYDRLSGSALDRPPVAGRCGGLHGRERN
jgi:hypothetical protein